MVHDRTPPARPYMAGVRSRNVLLDANNLLKQLFRHGQQGLSRWALDAADFCAQPVRWLTGREKPDTIDLDDPLPALKEIVLAFRKSASGLKKGAS
jgi:hypothetical protein